MKCPECGYPTEPKWWQPVWWRCECNNHLTKLSELEKAEQLNDDDLLLITQNKESKNITIAQLKKYLQL